MQGCMVTLLPNAGPVRVVKCLVTVHYCGFFFLKFLYHNDSVPSQFILFGNVVTMR